MLTGSTCSTRARWFRWEPTSNSCATRACSSNSRAARSPDFGARPASRNTSVVLDHRALTRLALRGVLLRGLRRRGWLPARAPGELLEVLVSDLDPDLRQDVGFSRLHPCPPWNRSRWKHVAPPRHSGTAS